MIHIPSHIDRLAPYQPGASQIKLPAGKSWDDIIMLASNENPLGVPLSAQEAGNAAMKKVNLYPDSSGTALKEAIAAHVGVEANEVHLGNGSDSILLRLMRAMCKGDEEVLTSEHTFAATTVQANIQHVPIRYVPMQTGYKFDLQALLSEITDQTKMVYLCNPNNPTGSLFTEKEVTSFLDQIPERILVVMDEAYYEFAVSLSEEYPKYHTYKRPNVLCLRTFSKAYGLAGLRIGYAIGDASIISVLDKVSLPFEPNAVAQAAALAALGDEDFMNRTVSLNKEVLQQYYATLDSMGITYIPTYANFVMVEFPSAAEVHALFRHFLQNDILVRKIGSLPNCIRIGTGTHANTEKVIEALKTFSTATESLSV